MALAVGLLSVAVTLKSFFCLKIAYCNVTTTTAEMHNVSFNTREDREKGDKICHTAVDWMACFAAVVKRADI